MSGVIVTSQMTKQYHGGKTGVSRLDLCIPEGAIYAFLGDNGAGKTTTMRVLTGQLAPDAGKAEILGLDCWMDAPALRHRVGYVPERPKFYDWMTVREIGWFTSSFYERGFSERFIDWCERIGLDPTKKLKELSKGGYARVGLALALAIDPDVLLLDEPTSGLDLHTRREFLTSMVDLASAGRTILISSHQIAEVERVASHVALLSDGKLLLAMPMDELKRSVRRVRLRFEGSPPDATTIGTVLERRINGRNLEVVVRHPDDNAIGVMRNSAYISDFEETSVSLEDIYSVLMPHPERKTSRETVAAEARL